MGYIWEKDIRNMGDGGKNLVGQNGIHLGEGHQEHGRWREEFGRTKWDTFGRRTSGTWEMEGRIW